RIFDKEMKCVGLFLVSPRFLLFSAVNFMGALTNSFAYPRSLSVGQISGRYRVTLRTLALHFLTRGVLKIYSTEFVKEPKNIKNIR
ncbi:MAG: hypothetical protein ACI8P3_004160, partial [Saprospiraceae bacterium]